MAEGKIEFGKLAGKDYAMGVGFVVIAMIIAQGLVAYLIPGAPPALLGAIGAAIGVAAWFSYLRKRNG
jgi:hypothetical protein